MLFGTTVTAEAVRDALVLASSSVFSQASTEGWKQLNKGDLGLPGEPSDTLFASSIDPKIGLYAFENDNRPGEIVLSYTFLPFSKIDTVFPQVLPIPPSFNTNYADDFAAVYSALNTKFPELQSVLATGTSLGGVAVNQLSKSFSEHFGSISSNFVAFGSEYISDNNNVLNIGASNDWFFGSYNDLSSEFVAGDSALADFPQFNDLVRADDTEASSIASSSFLSKFFALESRNTEELGTTNLFFAFDDQPSATTFNQPDFIAAHYFTGSTSISVATERVLNSIFLSSFDSDTALIIDFVSGAVSTAPQTELFSGSKSGKPIYLLGEERADTLNGGAGVDFIEGFGGNDTISGGSDNDTLVGGNGNDSIDGGVGLDVAQYAGAHSQLAITRQSDSTIAVDASGSGEGTDTLVNIERLKTADGTVAFDLDGAAGQTYRLYQAAFDRTPDQVGLSHNVNLMDQGLSIYDMANAFIASQEFQQTYGQNVNDTTFLTLLYNNVLNRTPDATGLAGWQSQLNGGTTREQVLFGFSESGENKANVAAAIDDGIWLV